MLPTDSFATRVLDWFDRHGRKDLPWQEDASPYRVWVSEIMLQQTQVKTVIPYFQRFMANFPSVQLLSAAKLDQVLHLWTGLGYYARARNLHRTAGIICDDLSGEFPGSVEALCELPGIGRSTAGAIRTIAFGKPATILDGNVKRVVARYAAVTGWPGKAAVSKRLWQIADSYTPSSRTGDFSQAMMDLGATVCTRATPACHQCPLEKDCEASINGEQANYPGSKPRKSLPVKAATFLIIRAQNGEVWLERRPLYGLWGGLWCFPELTQAEDPTAWCLDRWALEPVAEAWSGFRHSFSHYHLDIQPILLTLPGIPETIMEQGQQLWYNLRQPPEIGLAAPVARLLARLEEHSPRDG
ncbi:MAG: A/G-specific adenine glycosylase [Halieaceae bacterium]|jgi:A/G-specific adenine glycosylase|nr:A/G-specific adenine glycosylase [Halieaceae bacterium]